MIRGLVAAMLLATACESPTPSAPTHVVLVTIDTLRADHLGAYGYTRPTSPGIDALARESTLFETAVPTNPATGPSVASILTGTHRSTHRVFANGWTLSFDVETLAELLKARGFRTAARVANPTIDDGAGFAQGFDDFAVPATLERAGPGMLEGAPLVADAIRLIDAIDTTPTFLWLHLMDPHGPYFPPVEYRRRFDRADYVWPGDEPLPIGKTNFGLHQIPAYQAIEADTDPASYRARYDAEIRYVDDHVGAIVAALRRRGLWDRTLFVLTADHGESLGEHDYYFAHGWYLSDDCLHVPLLVHGPGFPASRRIRETVSLVDVAPTILETFGIPAPPSLEGRSLRPMLVAGAGDRDAFAQTSYGEGFVALRAGRLKYVFKPPNPFPNLSRPASDPALPSQAGEWLFDLANDPGETRDLVQTRPDDAARLRVRLRTWVATQEQRARGKSAEQPRKDGAPVRLLGDPQLERQLRALGYLD